MKSLSFVAAGLVLGLPQTLAAPSKSQIKWGKCNLPWGKETDAAIYGDVECATLKAPLDYTKPDNGKTIDLQLARVKAKVQPARGSVFYNPGGPGNSAVEYLVTSTEDYYKQVDPLAMTQTFANIPLIGFSVVNTTWLLLIHGKPSWPFQLCLRGRLTDYLQWNRPNHPL
jgi:hypothetical protein